jgi:hypothetical protein
MVSTRRQTLGNSHKTLHTPPSVYKYYSRTVLPVPMVLQAQKTPHWWHVWPPTLYVLTASSILQLV